MLKEQIGQIKKEEARSRQSLAQAEETAARARVAAREQAHEQRIQARASAQEKQKKTLEHARLSGEKEERSAAQKYKLFLDSQYEELQTSVSEAAGDIISFVLSGKTSV